MKTAINFGRLVFALLNQQTPATLALGAGVVPLTGFLLLLLIRLLNALAPLLGVALIVWGCLLLGLAVVKVATGGGIQ
jgi:hypothetical protein